MNSQPAIMFLKWFLKCLPNFGLVFLLRKFLMINKDVNIKRLCVLSRYISQSSRNLKYSLWNVLFLMRYKKYI